MFSVKKNCLPKKCFDLFFLPLTIILYKYSHLNFYFIIFKIFTRPNKLVLPTKPFVA